MYNYLMRQKRTETKEEYNARMNAYMKERYKKCIAWLQAYKVEVGCADCGYNEHHAGLQIDHLIPRNGDANKLMSKVVVRGIAAIQRELENCEVVCGTCHGIRTWQRRQEGPLV